jgi:two-component system, OmpR family, sensor histidine kinase BaeS
MVPTSLRWRLPLSYAGLALLTALLLNILLLGTLLFYYQGLEQAYLLRSGLSSSAALAPLLAASADQATLGEAAREASQRYGVRLVVRGAEGQPVVDSGPPSPLALAGGLFLEAAYGFDPSRRTGQSAEVTLQTPGSVQPLGWLTVSEGPAYGRDIVASVGWAGAAASVAAVVLAAGVGWLVSRRMVAPLAALTATSARLAGGDLTARASVSRPDEIGALAEAFNRMAGQVEGTVDTLRRFTADAAHELHTPLTALATDLELAAGETDPAQARAFVARARAQTARLAELSGDLLDLSRLEAGQAAEQADVDVSAVLEDLGEVYASRAEQLEIEFALEAPPRPVRVRGHAGQLRRAVGNLLDNALKFTPAGGRVTLALKVADQQVRVAVRDTGPGIPAEDVPRLFARFHRGRNAAGHSGSGLGLAIVRAIMEQQGGTVRVDSVAGNTTFELRWPALG